VNVSLFEAKASCADVRDGVVIDPSRPFAKKKRKRDDASFGEPT
jgi:hypothetical protein